MQSRILPPCGGFGILFPNFSLHNYVYVMGERAEDFLVEEEKKCQMDGKENSDRKYTGKGDK